MITFEVTCMYGPTTEVVTVEADKYETGAFHSWFTFTTAAGAFVATFNGANVMNIRQVAAKTTKSARFTKTARARTR